MLLCKSPQSRLASLFLRTKGFYPYTAVAVGLNKLQRPSLLGFKPIDTDTEYLPINEKADALGRGNEFWDRKSHDFQCY
ncbi:hypothetical protein CLV76_1543 [Marivita geojedonensis]|nr:hypothetical protein CLV76_1543 [Marivita geojedonensis]